MSQPSVSLNIADLSRSSYVVPVSPSWAGQTAISVCNPDGSNVIGGATIDISALTGDLTNNDAAPSNTNIGVLPAVANAAPQTWVEGNQVLLSTDLSGNLRTIDPAYTYENIPTSTTTLVKSGAGVLGLVALNTAGVTSTAKLYDGLDATGTLIATINTTVTGSSVIYNTAFSTGLTVVTAGGSPADITVMYM